MVRMLWVNEAPRIGLLDSAQDILMSKEAPLFGLPLTEKGENEIFSW